MTAPVTTADGPRIGYRSRGTGPGPVVLPGARCAFGHGFGGPVVLRPALRESGRPDPPTG